MSHRRTTLLIPSTIWIAAAAALILMPLAGPAFAYVNVGFEQQYQPDNPDGSWNVGSPVHLAVNTDCSSFSIAWGDGAIETYSMGDYLTVFVSHAYDAAAPYVVTVTGLCSGGGTGSLAVNIGGGLVGGQTLVGMMGVVLGLLGIGLGISGPSLKPPLRPAVAPTDDAPTVDLDKKVPLLKTGEEVQEQQRYFDEQRAGWQEPKWGGRAYLDRFHEVPHRLMDDPLTSFTLGPFLRMLESGTDVAYIVAGSAADSVSDVLTTPSSSGGISGPASVRYDPDVDRYYYDFTDPVSGREAVTQFGKASADVLLHGGSNYAFKGVDSTIKGLYNDYKYLENLGDPMPGAPYHPSVDAIYKYSASFDWKKFMEARRLWGG
jgi:hypothetical protein